MQCVMKLAGILHMCLHVCQYACFHHVWQQQCLLDEWVSYGSGRCTTGGGQHCCCVVHL